MKTTYGVKGMKSVSWRKVFATSAQLDAWVAKNDATVYGTRVDGGS